MDINSQSIYPLLVPLRDGSEDLPAELELKWDKVRALPERNRLILLSDEIKELILRYSIQHNLTEKQAEHFSRLIRSFFFGENSSAETGVAIGAIFHQDQAFGVGVLNEIQGISAMPAPATAAQANTPPTQVIPSEMLPLAEARDKYPQLGQQLVTKGRIIAKQFVTPMTPTVAHWISAYEAIAGVQKHTAIERGEFLYRSQPCRGLREIDRTKLAQLLKAHDEGTSLKISTEKGGIIWQKDSAEAQNLTPQNPQPVTPTPAQNPTPAPTSVQTTQPVIVAPNPPIQELPATPSLQQIPQQTDLQPHTQDSTQAPPPARQSQQIPRASKSPRRSSSLEPQLHSLPDSRIENAQPASSPALGSVRKSLPKPQPMPQPTTQPTSRPGVQHTNQQAPATPSLQHFAHQQTGTQQPLQRAQPSKQQSTQPPKNLPTTVNFSSGQTLPTEKSGNMTPHTTDKKRNPFHINPIG